MLGPVCETCGGSGRIELTGCPMEDASGAMAILAAADWAEKGIWPVAGGWMDQAEICVEAVRFALGELAQWKARLTNR